jgi:hypothetical protein
MNIICTCARTRQFSIHSEQVLQMRQWLSRFSIKFSFESRPFVFRIGGKRASSRLFY